MTKYEMLKNDELFRCVVLMVALGYTEHEIKICLGLTDEIYVLYKRVICK